MRRIIAGLVAIGGLSLFTAVTPAIAAPAIPAFSCVSGTFHFDALGPGDYGWINSANRFEVAGSYTGFCSNSKIANNVEFDNVKTNNCLTYGGPKAGPGYFYLKTCSHYASQTFIWYGNGQITDSYNGTSYCMNGPGFMDSIDVAPCNARNQNQLWDLDGFS